jgi:hypothetical protein
MSKETTTEKAAPRTRKPLITTKKSQPARRSVQDTSERQNALQKQHTKEYKEAHGKESEE